MVMLSTLKTDLVETDWMITLSIHTPTKEHSRTLSRSWFANSITQPCVNKDSEQIKEIISPAIEELILSPSRPPQVSSMMMLKTSCMSLLCYSSCILKEIRYVNKEMLLSAYSFSNNYYIYSLNTIVHAQEKLHSSKKKHGYLLW